MGKLFNDVPDIALQQLLLILTLPGKLPGLGF